MAQATPQTFTPGTGEQNQIQMIRQCRHEADMAMRTRKRKNDLNMRSYLGQEDWSHKRRGQSKVSIPKTPVTVETFAAFIKKALVNLGDWFSVDAPQDSMLRAPQIMELMKLFLDNLAEGVRDHVTFGVRMSDATKVGLLKALIVLKIHGVHQPKMRFASERGRAIRDTSDPENPRIVPQSTGKVKTVTEWVWQLAIDLIDPDDYKADPSGAKLYEIHRVERDLHDVMSMAEEDGIYDPAVVRQITQDFEQADETRRKARGRNQDVATSPSFRKKVVIEEYWGDMLKPNGHLDKRNIVAALANDRYLIRPAEENPTPHKESPFVAVPLIRVPFSVLHKALLDHASPLSMDINELVSLMLDGGLAAVHGVKQLHEAWLKEPSRYSNGIPAGETVVLNETAPATGKALEKVVTGEIPRDALVIQQLLDREYNTSVFSNDLKMGNLPQKSVKATEIIEVQQTQSLTIDSIASDLDEMGLSPTLRKAFLCILGSDIDFSREEIVQAIGSRAAVALARMTPAQRLEMFGNRSKFKVSGLAATVARARDFQKFMAYLQSVQANPVLFEDFLRRFSPSKTNNHIMKSLNINPDHFGMDEQERQELPQRQANMERLVQTGLTGNGNVKGASGEVPGESNVPAEVSQQQNPATGMIG